MIVPLETKDENQINSAEKLDLDLDRKLMITEKFNTSLRGDLFKAIDDISTPQEFVGVFIEQSAIFYTEANRVNTGSEEDLKADMQVFLDKRLLGTMGYKSNLEKKEVKGLIEALRGGMGDYVEALDNHTREVASYIKEFRGSEKNKFVIAGREIQGKDSSVEDTSWAKIAEFCEKFSKTLAEFFDKKNDAAKEKSIQKSVDKISKKLNVKEVISRDKGNAKNTPSRSNDNGSLGK